MAFQIGVLPLTVDIQKLLERQTVSGSPPQCQEHRDVGGALDLQTAVFVSSHNDFIFQNLDGCHQWLTAVTSGGVPVRRRRVRKGMWCIRHVVEPVQRWEFLPVNGTRVVTELQSVTGCALARSSGGNRSLVRGG